MKRDKDQIKRAIKNQLTYIKNSCFLYDCGCQEEAIRIASSISVLLEERSGGSKGLLRILDGKFKLLSTIPDMKKVDTDVLTVLTCKNIQEKNKENDEFKFNRDRKFLLTYVEDIKEWFLYAITFEGRIIKCPMKNLLDNLYPKMRKKMNLLVSDFWLKKLISEKGDVCEIVKHIIVEHLDSFLKYNTNYIPGMYFPMIDTFDTPKPILANSEKRFLEIDNWLSEIIFCIEDNERKKHYLTRKKLIYSSRDQDGGGHYDIKLKETEYIKSRYGEVLGIFPDGGEFSTKNFHLIMLRQLGYEMLNSPI